MIASLRGPGLAGPVLTVLLTVSDVRGNPGGGGAVPRLESAAAQLAHASSLRSEMRGKEGDNRSAGRQAAIDAYRAVREYFASDARACAEAAFRGGELLRSAEDVNGAFSEFQVAFERGADTPFRVRAELEIGHLHRRARDQAKALAAYEAVLADAAATPGQRDDASYWTGHVYAEQKRIEDARRVWQRVADRGEDPLDRVRAWDCIAQSYVAGEDLEAAAGVLERCREALADTAAEETRLGERVRTALASMRASEELQRAVDKRARSKEDATREEGVKKK